MDRYFVYCVIAGETIEREVTLEEYCRAERNAGFRPKISSDHPKYMVTPATSGFGRNGMGGRVERGERYA